jgi:hypothetical protein
MIRNLASQQHLTENQITVINGSRENVLIQFSVIDDDDIEPEPIPIQEAEEGDTIPIIEEQQEFHESESEQEEENENDSEEEIQVITTRSGCEIRAAKRLIAEAGYAARDELDSDYSIELTSAENVYYEAMRDFPQGEFYPGEIACVGVGIGGGFANTMELHVMKYDQAINGPEAKEWAIAVEEEHNRMLDHEVFQTVPREEVPNGSKILTSTWAMKKKANGVHRARLNARGYEQVDGEHYDEDDKFAPVVTDATIHIVLIQLIMAGWYVELIDVKGAFLHGVFEKGRKVYMEVPQGFERFYPKNCVLLLLKTLYGTKQAAKAFWLKLLVEALRGMKYTRSKADPCLYYSWNDGGLVIWISWVDDCLICGKKESVLHAKEEIKKIFDCDEVGELKEYVGCKIDYNKEEGWIKMIQPVLMQSYVDEFELPKGETPRTPATPGSVLQKVEPKDYLPDDEQFKYRSGVGKLLHMMKWTRPEILNAVRELSRFMMHAGHAHLREMYRAMKYCVGTPNRGFLLKPTMKWDGNPNFEFKIKGQSDSDFAKDPERHRSASGYSTFLCGASVTTKSRMQGCVTLDVMSAEYVSGTQCAQEMLFDMRVLESMGLKVEKPMILEIDKKGAVDLSKNWSVS